MNIVDIVVLGLFALFLLCGWFRGFVSTLLSIGAYIFSAAIAFLTMPLLANWVKSNAGLYKTMLYYTEGSEFVTGVSGGVELAKTPISAVSAPQLSGVMQAAEVPHPLGERISENIAKEAFAGKGITTLGEYFNETIVCVFINILCFLALFAIIRLVLAFVIHLIDYARGGYPVLHTADGLIGSGFGLIRGFLAMFMVFTAVPIFLVVLPDIVGPYIDASFFGGFFYNSNFLLSLIPGV